MRLMQFVIGTVCLFLSTFSFSQHAGYDEKAALSISQAVIGQKINNYQLTDTRGGIVNLHDLLGKPLIVSLIYTSCYHICPMTTQHLRDVVDIGRDTFGDDFNVVTIGFDTLVDTPPMMEQFAKKQQVDDANWLFLSTDAKTINELIKDYGFQFFSAPHGFDHLIQASIVKANGEVYRQVYGVNFEMPLLLEPLKELILGESAEASLLQNVTNKIRLFCTVYDAKNERYYIDYSVFIGTFIGIMCVGLFGYQLAKEWRKTLNSS